MRLKRRSTRWTVAFIFPLALGGCYTVGSLETSAANDERRAEYLAEMGEGPAAQKELNRAISEREEARRRAERRNAYIESEVLLE